MFIAPRPPAGNVLRETPVVDYVERLDIWSEHCFQPDGIRLEQLVCVVVVHLESGLVESLNLSALVICRGKDLITGLKAEGAYAVKQTLPCLEVDTGFVLIERERELTASLADKRT